MQYQVVQLQIIASWILDIHSWIYRWDIHSWICQWKCRSKSSNCFPNNTHDGSSIPSCGQSFSKLKLIFSCLQPQWVKTDCMI